MRKVKMFKRSYKPREGARPSAPQVSFLEPVGEGYFHAWGLESPDGSSSYSVALVELADGTIASIVPDLIRFVEPTVLSQTNVT